MADDDDDDAEGGEDEHDPEEVRTALRALRGDGGDDEPALGHVLTLVIAAERYPVPLVPAAAIAAVDVRFAIARDVNNGGMDQVAWNHGHEATRGYAAALREVGAIENADLLDRLAGVLERYHADNTDEQIAADPIKHFLAFRTSVGGPAFGIPEPDQELAEALVEYVIERADSLPDPDALPAPKPSSPE